MSAIGPANLLMRSHYCGALSTEHIGEQVSLCGWTESRRDHGGVIFLDLRDRTGIVQAVFDPDAGAHFHTADKVRSEFVLQVKGKVRARSEDTVNPAMATGALEVLGQDLTILNTANPLPFQLDQYTEVSEEVRLRHRYLDLRRPAIRERLQMRARLTAAVRHFLEERDFLDIETPMLTRATPEGARDYLVPSRVHVGSFYALPQSPQLFKQLLMVGGLDRYYQIARCFRDEDLRADRQPEFTQVDIEASFVDQEAIMDIAEGLLRHIFQEFLSVELPPFPRMDYDEALTRFGSDCPDLRIPLELTDVADLLQDVEFKVFREPASRPDSRVAVLRVPGGGNALSRREIDDYTDFVTAQGASGLAWIRVKEQAAGSAGLQSPILKFLPAAAVAALLERVSAEDGDILFFGAGPREIVNRSLGSLRQKLGADLGLFSPDSWAPLWVINFPLFERDAEGRQSSVNHPFTAPAHDLDTLEKEPAAARGQAYDAVLNGIELGGGSVRIHHPETQMAVFRILGFSPEEARERFGFLLDALGYGCPPHGGIAFGLDRLAMLLSGAESIRDVIAFPKTQSAACPMTGAPGAAEESQLRELHLGGRKR